MGRFASPPAGGEEKTRVDLTGSVRFLSKAKDFFSFTFAVLS
jgi:hypothetical protein